MCVPVLIVGAGPTGLMLAVELARRGVEFRIIDRHAAPLGWDRATVVKARTLEIADMLGLAGAFLEKGQRVDCVDLYAGGDRVAQMGFADLDTSFPYMLSLPESDTEAILTAELERCGGAVERGIELTALDAAAEGCRACLRVGSGADETMEIVEADWVVGTDGLHSTVRHAVGDAFEGHDNPRLWGVVDGYLDGWKHPGHHIAANLVAPCANPIPLKDGRWRVYFRPQSRDVGELERVVASLGEMSPGVRLADPDEPKFFHTYARVAAMFRVGRVMVAGDAAHACSPIQGHGMNSGIQDAHNLGWKLALVVAGHAPERLLDSYEIERKPADRFMVDSSDKAENASVRQDPAEREQMIAYLADPANNRRAAEDNNEMSHSYADSPIVGEGGGLRLADAPLVAPPGKTRVYEILRDGAHHLFLLGGAANSATIAQPHARHVNVHCVATEPDGVAIGEPQGSLWARLADVVLVRPDGYIACAGRGEAGLAAARHVLVATFGEGA